MCETELNGIVRTGMVIACWLEAPGKLTFADVVSSYTSKKTIVIEHLDKVGNRKLARIDRKQVVKVIANARKAYHENKKDTL
jgi:hypothetical protein